MQVNKEVFEKIMGPVGSVDLDIKVSLFIVSKKDPRLKKLDLSGLTPQQRVEKLQKWAQNHRFVAVIQMGDQVFAHANAQVAEKLESKGVSLDGKKVAIKALTDEESEKLAAVGKAFEEYAIAEAKEEEKTEKQKDRERRSQAISREYAALINDPARFHEYIDRVIARMDNVPGQVILQCMKRFEEARREEQKQAEADAKHYRIVEDEIKKGIKKEEIKKEEIVAKAQQQSHVGEDAQRVNRIRGNSV